MAKRRSFSASLIDPATNYFFVTGGIDYTDGSILSSTEYITENGSTFPGIPKIKGF